MQNRSSVDEIIVFQGPGSALRRQAVQDAIDLQKAILDTLDHTQFERVRRIVAVIEALRDEQEAIDEQMALEGL